MKQNKNKNITKITSGALVLLLASGCYIGNSNAEGIKTDSPDMEVSDKESKPAKESTIGDAIKKISETTEKKENKSQDEKENSVTPPTDEGSPAQPQDESKIAEESIGNDNSNNKDDVKPNNNRKENNKEISAENSESQTLTSDKKEEETKEAEDTPKTKDENKNKPADDNNVGKESEAKNTNTKEEKTESTIDSDSKQSKLESQTVPGQGDDQNSKKLKSEIAGEINNIKALVNDGTWSEESVKAAKAKITNLEAFLLKGDLKDKDLAEVKSALNDIQINVLKKKIVKETNVVKNDDKKVVSNEKSNKLSQKTVIKSNTDNVQTGVGSLSSVLLTLGSSSLALFAGKKRK
ncbi:hypothetical protein [Anaerococcus hydrogenalis]|uniref:Putative lipoprotein n=1 Tax=Anaerococcus hydrogenalis ACS-025-V-Sch4 TaxID=879306 RepID=F0GZH6_9FIRM|nr:hypothetical protein [Anaerococcus hydrogenalis]EGC84277.1 putative lipoprotein [Anaerococcus hydrogenalis ACS-025-V-Sch4]